MWRIARDSGVLDLNSSYAYLLWCTDFPSTSAVARVDGEPIGFVAGYLRPSGSLMIWQVGVDEAYRGFGLAASMLGWLADSLATLQGEPLVMETTVTQSNTASRALFAGFAAGGIWSSPNLPDSARIYFPTRTRPSHYFGSFH